MVVISVALGPIDKIKNTTEDGRVRAMREPRECKLWHGCLAAAIIIGVPTIGAVATSGLGASWQEILAIIVGALVIVKLASTFEATTVDTDRNRTMAQVATEAEMNQVHPDRLGEPDEHGRIHIGVENWNGPDPAIEGLRRGRVFMDRMRRPCRIVTYEPVESVEASRR